MSILYTFWKNVAVQRDVECRDLDDENIRLRRRVKDLERELDRFKQIVDNLDTQREINRIHRVVCNWIKEDLNGQA